MAGVLFRAAATAAQVFCADIYRFERIAIGNWPLATGN